MEETTSRLPAQTLVIGVGNRWRRDDGAGLVVAEAIRARDLANVTVQLCEMDPLALLDRDLDAQRLILVDALQAPKGPCAVHRFEDGNPPLRRESASSSHGFGLAETLELARSLRHWPHQTVVYAVEGWDFSHGEGLSVEATLATQECVRLAVRGILTWPEQSLMLSSVMVTTGNRICGPA